VSDPMHDKEQMFTVHSLLTPKGEGLSLFQMPAERWEWVIFGDPALITIRLRGDVSWWRRMTTKLLFGSTWRKLS
jgi:hypothetical protein